MSHIPNSAMPHAAAAPENETNETEESFTSSLKDRAGKLADTARANPKTAIAAGAAVVAGVVAAAAIPLVRARKSTDAKSKSGTSKKS